MGLCPWNPERIRERCQNNATGVTPDSLSDAADILVQRTKEQDVMHAQRVKSNGSCLEEVPPSTIGTLRFPSFGGRQKMKKRPGSQHSQQQSECAAIKRSPTLVSTMWIQAGSVHAVMQAMGCAAIQLAAALISGPKSGSRVQRVKRLFARLTRPACADNHALPFRHNTHFAHATCSRARMQTTPKRMPFGKICHSP